MKIVCTTVVRAAKPGDIHGGFYVIDTDTEEILHYMEYDEDFTNENERGGERGLRGIAVLDDRIIVSNSTGFLELDRQTFEIKRSHKDESVLRSHRGAGIGSLLIKSLIKTAKQQKCYKVILNCSDKNIPFYNQFGFIKIDNGMKKVL